MHSSELLGPHAIVAREPSSFNNIVSKTKREYFLSGMVAMKWEVELAREADDGDVQLLDDLVIGVPVEPLEDSVSRVLKNLIIVKANIDYLVRCEHECSFLPPEGHAYLVYLYSAFHVKGIPKG